MTLTVRRLAIVMVAASAAACQPDVELGGGYRTVVDVPPEPIDDLDVLFVIDNSGSMAPHQEALVDSAGTSLFAQLDAELGGRPDLHVAVVSTNMGAGSYGIGGCADPDDGVFQSVPRGACEPPDGSFLVDVDDGMGGRETNYTGDISDVFGCIAQLGIDGCGFEQPMEAMRRALGGNHPENDGFLRDEALLLIVFVTDEDDCSAFDTALFDTSQNQLSEPLGPLASFRCFEFGTVCDGDEPRVPGAKTGCVPRDDSPYITPVSEYVDFLTALKDEPSKVMVAGIFGDTAPVEVEADDNADAVRLADICGGGEGRVDPAPRLHALLDAFPALHEFEPICGIAFAESLARIARRATAVMSGSTCLAEDPLDTDAERDGLQPTCRVYDVDGTARQEIDACGSAGASPCFEVVSDAAECPDTSANLRIEVRRDGERPAGTRLVAECVIGAD